MPSLVKTATFLVLSEQLSWQSQRCMDEPAKVSFSIHPFEKGFAVTPTVNGVPLTEMILTFETAHSFESEGGYGGSRP
jgi:hypothetical protein